MIFQIVDLHDFRVSFVVVICIELTMTHFNVMSWEEFHNNSVLTAHNWQKWKKNIPDMSLP